MAADKMVNSLKADLRKLTDDLDSSLANLILCMIFQKRPAINPDAWTLCVSANGLDELSDRAAIAYILRKLEEDCTPETSAAIERVLVLRSFDSATLELLRDIESEEDARLLIGRSVFGRTIGRAQLFLVRNAESVAAPRQVSLA